MKGIIVCLWMVWLALPIPAAAQFLGGFFNQKATERKYMMQQIALYRLYLGYAKKGYGIAKDGLNTVKDIRSGELGLHTDYYSSLKTVKPVIAGSKDVKSILRFCEQTARLMAATRQASLNSFLSPGERSYLSRVDGQVQKEMAHIISALEQNCSGQIQATDDERIQRNLALLDAARDMYAFCVSFSGKVQGLAAGRRHTQQETTVIKRLYDLP